MGEPDKPAFRFYPRAYDDGVLKREGGPCEICRREGTWIYQGVVYAVRDEMQVCARCIAEGRLLAFLDDPHFQLHDIEIEGVGPDLRDELLRRTPGVECFNPFNWPALRGMPLAFAGHGDGLGLWEVQGARMAMEAAWRERMGSALDGASPYLLVFRELNEGAWRAEVDLD
ncbi:MAG: CbrC family protein [Pseudomonadota bacterium]